MFILRLFMVVMCVLCTVACGQSAPPNNNVSTSTNRPGVSTTNDTTGGDGETGGVDPDADPTQQPAGTILQPPAPSQTASVTFTVERLANFDALKIDPALPEDIKKVMKPCDKDTSLTSAGLPWCMLAADTYCKGKNHQGGIGLVQGYYESDAKQGANVVCFDDANKGKPEATVEEVPMALTDLKEKLLALTKGSDPFVIELDNAGDLARPTQARTAVHRYFRSMYAQEGDAVAALGPIAIPGALQIRFYGFRGGSIVARAVNNVPVGQCNPLDAADWRNCHAMADRYCTGSTGNAEWALAAEETYTAGIGPVEFGPTDNDWAAPNDAWNHLVLCLR